MSATKRARSASQDGTSLSFGLLSEDNDIDLFPRLESHPLPSQSSGTGTNTNSQSAAATHPPSFKSARTNINTSPTARTHTGTDYFTPNSTSFPGNASMTAAAAAGGSAAALDQHSTLGSHAFDAHNASTSFSSCSSMSVTGTPALSSTLSSNPSPRSPGGPTEPSPLDGAAMLGSSAVHFNAFYQDGPQQPHHAPQAGAPIAASKPPASSQAFHMPQQAAWSSYTTPSPSSVSPFALNGPHSGGSGSSYRGSMDDSLGLGAGYGIPNTALASLGLNSALPVGLDAATGSAPATAGESGSMLTPPTIHPAAASTSFTPYSSQPQHTFAPVGPPPQQPLPAVPTASQTTALPASSSRRKPPQWQNASPSGRGFRETRKGEDLGLGLEDFEVIETLGTGTFGRVLLCRLLRSPLQNVPQYFAMKVLQKIEVVRLKQIQHINAERSILTAVRQNGIVNLFCTFQDEKNLYFLLEFIQGGELFSHLRRAGRFSADVARFYAANILLTLEYLHKQDIIYRDLKPENLLLDHQGYIKITDFGFAKFVPDRTFTLCGTPEYLAPEIIQSTGHGKAADYWALGVLLFEMLCGYPCFWADHPLGIYEKILAGNVYFPDHVDPCARDLIRRLLSSDLSKRLGNLCGGVRDIMEHPWFEGVDWDMVRRREIMAPIVPRARSAGDCSHFEKYGQYSLNNLPALARAAQKRARMAMGTWREPTEQEKDLLRRKCAAEDHFAEYFADF